MKKKESRSHRVHKPQHHVLLHPIARCLVNSIPHRSARDMRKMRQKHDEARERLLFVFTRKSHVLEQQVGLGIEL